jgi:cell division septum initiation protein DivIVA
VGTGTGSTESSGSVTTQAKDAVSTATTKAKEQGSDLTHKAHEQVDAATQQLASRADERKDQLTAQARTLEGKLREFATSIGDEQPKLGEAAESLVDRVGGLVDYVERTPVEDMTRELRDSARRHPMLFAAGMFGIGFALTRALRPVDSPTTTTPLLTTTTTDGGGGGMY